MRRNAGHELAEAFVEKKAMIDPQTGQPEIYWALEGTCWICGDRLDTLFVSCPNDLAVLEALAKTCPDCVGKEDEFLEKLEKENPEIWEVA